MTKKEYSALKRKHDAFLAALAALFPERQSLPTHPGYSPAEWRRAAKLAGLSRPPTLAEGAALDNYEHRNNPRAPKRVQGRVDATNKFFTGMNGVLVHLTRATRTADGFDYYGTWH